MTRVLKIPRVAQIILDLIEVLGISSSPILLLLSSSKFSHCSFPVDQITSWDLDDLNLRVKSPFLADETLIKFSPDDAVFSQDESTRGVSYANSRLINSWSNVLRFVGNPVVGISPIYMGMMNWALNPINSLKNTIFCDVEPDCCNLLIKRSISEFNSYQLPFGSALYAGQSGRLMDQFINRLQAGLDVIKEDQALDGDFQGIISGYGLGEFGVSIGSSFSSWSLLSGLLSKDYQVSSGLKPGELNSHLYLFPQIVVNLSAYLF